MSDCDPAIGAAMVLDRSRSSVPSGTRPHDPGWAAAVRAAGGTARLDPSPRAMGNRAPAREQALGMGSA